jgi:hypothetical protein
VPAKELPHLSVLRHGKKLPHGKTTRRVIVDDISRPVWTGQARTLHLPLYNSPGEPLVPFRITLRVAERVTGTRTSFRKRKLPQVGEVHRA